MCACIRECICIDFIHYIYIYILIYTQWYIYIIDSLLDFRNPSNVDNNNELDFDTYSSYTMTRDK